MKNGRLPRFDERSKHALWAVFVATFVGMANLLFPLDILFWQVKARVQDKQPSNEIVFVSVDSQLSLAQGEQHFARLLEIIDAQDPGAVYVNVRFPDAVEADSFAHLRAAIERFEHPIYSVATILDSHATSDQLDGDYTVFRNPPDVVGNIPQVYASRFVRFFGYTQEMEYSYVVDGVRYPSFPVVLAGIEPPEGDIFPIDYTFDFERFPAYESADLIRGPLPAGFDIRGKTVVIGSEEERSTLSSIPGRLGVAPSYIFMYAAETLKSGVPRQFGWLYLFLANALAIGAACFLHSRPRERRSAYMLAGVLTLCSLIVYLTQNIELLLAPALALLGIFGVLRLWAWKARLELLKDTASGLPSFLALRDDIAHGNLAAPAVVVVRVGHFNDIQSVLDKEQIRHFKTHIARLISVASGNARAYCEGRLFAFALASRDSHELIQHCDGLRALCDSGWSEGGVSADIVVTFGIDRSEEPEFDVRLAAAVAAAERARESVNPIEFSTIHQKSAKSFEISIQSRIDAALQERDIHVVYQPQLDLADGSLAGAEALVRWDDPVHGSIPPSFFIQQCEENGRLDALSKYVAFEALAALKKSNDAGFAMTMSLNISAIQLANTRIVDILRECVEQTGVDPADIIVEITETAKIADYAFAERVLAAIRAMGIRTSIDDFGVGMTNLETLLKLPFDELKVDRLFVSRLKTDPKARMIVQSMVNLGKDGQMQVVAEGVEDAETLYALSRLQCDLAQGYHISRPLAERDFMEFQRLSNTRAAET